MHADWLLGPANAKLVLTSDVISEANSPAAEQALVGLP